MKKYLRIVSTICLFMVHLFSCQGQPPGENEATLRAKADSLANAFIIVDTHIDAPLHVQRNHDDLTRLTDNHFDYPRAKQGGLNAAFMSVYISPEYQGNGAKREADHLIDLVDSVAASASNKFAIAATPADIRDHYKKGLISLPMGMENGAPIEGNLENLRYFSDRGIRYITLTHSKDNHICDSSYDTTNTWNGLSPFGKRLIPAMNRIGMMIDISHVTDSTFYQVLRLSDAPVIASHSSCRHFLPGFERNMSDEMIRLLAENGGVIQINFGSYFVSNDYRTRAEERQHVIQSYLLEHDLDTEEEQAQQFIEQYDEQHPLEDAHITDVVEHIDHVVRLAGVDHVGLGSDFDGVGSVPEGLENVSKYPNLIYHLLKKGYSADDLRKICGENLLRVWEMINKTSRALSQTNQVSVFNDPNLSDPK